MNRKIDVQINCVETGGDELNYEVRGQGSPPLLIPGGGGDGWWYTPITELLADEYKVITYDSRANARSTAYNFSTLTFVHHALLPAKMLKKLYAQRRGWVPSPQ